ncbi:MAG: AAA family ATPase [Prevotella sp.]|nr:AAA family ATPase [Prevotella sp.]
MKIKRIYAENYKTYKNLDLNLEVTNDRPIILIGGGNGCGKTTLFDAIYHALYGLNVKTPHQFEELFNAGERLASGLKNKYIVLQVDFSGMVLNTEQQYRLKRAYMLADDRVLESVTLSMGGNTFVYGSGSTAQQRATNEEIVNKIIAANLPKELSYYFLFDAMKTSELLKEEQINKLIEKNINSVMGFNKYSRMRKGAETLLAEKKAERLENENQRLEYGKLTATKEDLTKKVEQLSDEYAEALDYANEHQEQYNQLKEGRNADDVTREKMQKIEQSIQNTLKSEKEYRQNLDNLSKDIETKVIFPKLASLLSTEIEVILHAKEDVATARVNLLSDKQIEVFTNSLVKLIQERYYAGQVIDVPSLIEEMKQHQERENKVEDRFAFLNPKDIQRLKNLVYAAVANPFTLLDDQRVRLNQEIHDLPRLRELQKDYQRALNGSDYSIIELYENNTKKINELKEDIEKKKDEIRDLGKKIATYDYDIPQIPDPQYDLLCKLPDFFKDLSIKLLRAKKASIERMMRDQLNEILVVYKGVIGRVELSSGGVDDISFKIYHKDGNEIYLSQLNAGAKQTVMQVLLKVLYNLGDYEPPVMIDTVMGVLDKESREVILESYFPDLAHQTILLSTDTEITTEHDFAKIQAHVAKTYTLHRDKEKQCTFITEDYFGLNTQDF